MKNLFILLILLGYQVVTLGQNPNQNGNNKSINTYWETEIEGSPFIPQDWGKGKFIDGSNKSFENISLRYNAYSQLIEYKQNDIAYNPNGVVKTASIEKNGVLYEFRTGFAAIDKQTEQSLYQVLYEGKNKILNVTPVK